MDVLHSLDGPAEWRRDSALMELSGWCIGVVVPVRAVEALVDGAPHPVRSGLPRPDVAAHHPGVPGAKDSGFRMSFLLAPGRHEIELRALRDGAPAVVLRRDTIEVGLSA